MKTLKYLLGMVPAIAMLLFAAGCGYEGGEMTNQVVETMTLTPSAESVVLNPDDPNGVALTFEWTQAREMPDEYLITYVTKLDVMGNNFAVPTTIRNEENDGVFSKSYTHLELHTLLLDKWNRPSDRATSLDFEVIAKWDGGSKYAMPEVRKSTVSIMPYKPVTFDFTTMSTSGSALPGGAGQFAKTPENEFIYVWTGQLIAGEFDIKLEFDGSTSYLYPTDMDGKVTNGEVESVAANASRVESWNITEAGEYRVIVDVNNKTLTMQTPGNVLQPAVVVWPLNGVNQTTTVTGLWLYGEPTGWGWGSATNPDCKPSLVDPQVFIYSGSNRSGRTKFGVYPNNGSYVYGPVNTTGAAIASVPISTGVETNMGAGAEAFQRNTYFGIPGGTNYMVIDIRRMKITVGQR